MYELQSTTIFQGGRSAAADQARRLFDRELRLGLVARLWATITGRSPSLRQLPAARTARDGGRLGLQSVPLGAVVGTESRSRDFDARMRPVAAHTRGRWVSVASARLAGRGLPPVTLVLGEDGYYVRDGHHRISVARALGEETIEAEVLA